MHDLGEMREQLRAAKEAEDAAEAQKQMDAAIRRVQDWDKAMKKPFKGIFPAPRRRKFMLNSYYDRDR